MITKMTTCKGGLSVDATTMVAPGSRLLQHLEQPTLDASTGATGASMVSSLALQQANLSNCSEDDIEVDLREVYFLVMHFLADGPCTRAFGQLWNELLQHKLLPRRYHAWYSREGQPNEDENDDGLSLPLSYRDIANRHPTIHNSHLVDLLQQLLVNSRRSAVQTDATKSKVVTAADAPTLLGSGSFSLLDVEQNRQRQVISSWTRHLRWPHWQADQVHGLVLRELGGGFARHHRSPSVRTASYVIAKPTIFFHRIQIIKKLRGHRNAVYCAIFDRTGQHVITGSDDRLVKIWSTETGLCLRSCRGHEGDITDLAVNSSNKLVASASNDFSIRVWRLPDGFPVSVLRGHGGAVTAIAFSPRQGCEHHLLSSSDDGTCRIWDARDSSVNSRVYMPDPKESQATVRGTSVPVPQGTPTGNQILCCAFNADGSIFVTGSSDKLARVWNATKWNDELTGRPNYELDTLTGHENDVNYVQFSGCAAPSRPFPADIVKEEHLSKFKNTWSAHDSIVTCSRDGSAIIWTPRPRRHHAKAGRWIKAYHLRVPPPPMPPQPPRPGGPRQRLLPTPRGVNMIVWSLDNRFVLAAIMDCRICVWNAVDGSLVHSLTGHDKQTYVLDVHPFNPRIAMSAGYDGRVIIWDIWDGHPIRIYDTGDYNLVDGNFSPDGASLVVSDEVGQIYLFATGEGNSQKDAKYDQFFLGDFRPLVRDTHGNVLDQETQLPPHQRNIQDLLCDASMIPYSEPYQTIYQQRRLGALGIDWQPPAMSLVIGTLDDPLYTGAPDQPIAFPTGIERSPERRERRAVGLERGSRWVEQPIEVDEAMDWEQDVAGLSEDSGSDYSASEETDEDGDKGESLDEAETEEDEDDDGSRDGSRLRRSRRNKRKAEVVVFSSSGRRLKRKRYDDAGESQGYERRSLRRLKASTSKPGVSGVKYYAEPSARPKRLAARNALHLFSSINNEEEEETALQPDIRVLESSDKASGSGETHRVLRSRNKEEVEEGPKVASNTASKVEPSDIGEFSRRPRSQRKLVVKLRTSGPKLDCENSRPEASGEILADTPCTELFIPEVCSAEDGVGNSHPESVTQRPPRKLVVKPPRPTIIFKRGATVLSSLEGSHSGHENGTEHGPFHRRQAHFADSEDDYPVVNENVHVEGRQSWEWRKGKSVKRPRDDESPEPGGSTSVSHNSGSCKSIRRANDVQDGNEQCRPSGKFKANSNFLDDAIQNHAKLEDKRYCESEDEICAVKEPVLCDELQQGYINKHVSPVSNQFGELHSARENQALESENLIYPENAGSALPYDSPVWTSSNERKLESKYVAEQGELCTKVMCVEGDSLREAGMPNEPLHTNIGEGGGAVSKSGCGEDIPQEPAPLSDNTCHAGGLGQQSQRARGWDIENVVSDHVVVLEGSLNLKSYHPGSEKIIGTNKNPSLIGESRGPTESDHETDVAECQSDEDLENDDCDLENDDGDDDVGDSTHQTESLGHDSVANSESELFDGNGVCGRNWSNSGDKGTDEDSGHEVQQRATRPKRRRALGEFGLYSRHASINSRQQNTTSVETGKTRVRHLHSVLFDGGRETRTRTRKSRTLASGQIDSLGRRSSRKQSKAMQKSPIIHGSYDRVLRTRQGRSQDGATSLPGNHLKRGHRGQGSGSAEQDGNEGSVELSNRRVASVGKFEHGRRQFGSKERRISRRTQEEGKREVFEKAKLDKDGRSRRGRKVVNHRIEGLQWLLLTDVEEGTRYIPQFGDDVVYLRQGHQAFLESSNSEEKGPWRVVKADIRAVEYCRITDLNYVIQPDGGTCCNITLKFTDSSSKVYGKTFNLSLPELTNNPDFIVERSRYDASMKKGWVVRDRCQVWWINPKGEGEWWVGRIKAIKPISPEFPDSPWERFLVLYKLDSTDITPHSPWELFELESRWADPPRIDDISKEHLLSAINEMESGDNQDEYGIWQSREMLYNTDYVNRTPLPLNMETIKQRLERDYYHSLQAFQHDVKLLVHNAQQYFGPDAAMTVKMNRLADEIFLALSDDDDEDDDHDASSGNKSDLS